MILSYELIKNLQERTGLKAEVFDSLISLAQKHDLSKLVLFGSRSRGEYDRVSDIDLALGGGDKDKFKLDATEYIPTLLQFDFVDIDSNISDALRQEIDGGIVIYEKTR